MTELLTDATRSRWIRPADDEEVAAALVVALDGVCTGFRSLVTDGGVVR